MSGAWTASSAGIILIGTCAVLLWTMGKHGSRLPSLAHPWVHRVLIAGMFVGGDAVALSALGAYPRALLLWCAGVLGPFGHVVLVIAALILFFGAAAGLAFVPDAGVAYIALALPFVAYVAGGHLLALDLWLPVEQWSAGISAWIGG